jgi:hypothetical protein
MNLKQMKIGETIIASPMEVANTIKSQISGRELMALGANGFIALPERDGYLGGLMFKCSLFGKKPVTVKIQLNGTDLYDIEIINNLNKKPIYNLKDAYNDMLTDVIVNAVEEHFGSDYRR